MNILCECQAAGFCPRHKALKVDRDFELCKGLNCTVEQNRRYWKAWERGAYGNPPVAEPKEFVEPPMPAPRARGLGDRVARLTARLGVPPCGGCKDRQAWLNHVWPLVMPPVRPVGFTSPTRHLTFHLWPVRGYGAWQWNCDRLLERAELFNGRRIVAIAVDGDTDPAEAVQEYLRGFTDEFIVVRNEPKLREAVTWLTMLRMLEQHKTDQDVTFSCHGKCVRHHVSEENARGRSTIFEWTKAMYETLLSDVDEVEALLSTHAMAGSFRRYMVPQRNGWSPWHYSGTFYWWRNADVYARNWEFITQKFFGTEAWPGWLFRPEEVAVVVGDEVGDLYDMNYWTSAIVPQLEKWRSRFTMASEQGTIAP